MRGERESLPARDGSCGHRELGLKPAEPAREDDALPCLGIIANPSSGHDVRRLVSRAETVTHWTKTNGISRVLAGLQAIGPCRVLYMPERLGLVPGALESLERLDGLSVQAAPIKALGTPEDTLAGVRTMKDAGCGLIVTFGGDGTNRLAAMTAGDVPLLPLSAGTNNIFPLNCEGTRAGIAAGIYLKLRAEGRYVSALCWRHKLLVAHIDAWRESALVDLAFSHQASVGGRAVWSTDMLQALYVTRCSPAVSGLCGIPGAVLDIPPQAPYGAAVLFGSRFKVQAVLTAGSVRQVGLDSVERMNINDTRTVNIRAGTMLADGERLRELRNQTVTVTLLREGPWVLDVEKTLARGLKNGILRF